MDCVETIKKVLWNKLNEKNPTSLVTKYVKDMHLFGEESDRLKKLYLNQ